MLLLAVPSAASADFGVESFSVAAKEADGTIDEMAATHPFALDVGLSLNPDQTDQSAESLHEVQIDLPPGLVGNPLAVPRCSVTDFSQSFAQCPASSQIGVIRGIAVGLGQITAPLYNVEASPGSAATFGVSINGESFALRLNLIGAGAASRVRLNGTVPSDLDITALEAEIWGVPTDQAHDAERECATSNSASAEGCASSAPTDPLLTLPASCSEPLRTDLTARSLGPPAVTALATALSRDAGGNPRPLSGCEAVPFDPHLTVQTGPAAQAPTALTVGVELPQYEGADLTAAAPLAGLHLELPEGMALNPSSGSWLVGCSPAAIGLVSAPGTMPAFDEDPASCPASSRLGTVKVRTPLIDHELSGAIYLATPTSNPFATRYAFYLAVEDQATATVLKIPARLDTDSATGRLTATIVELPPLPLNELDLEFAGGTRAPLVSPSSCGKYTVAGTLTPSTAPDGPSQTRLANFNLSAAAGGKPCPPPETQRNVEPFFQAGTTVPTAGGDSPLVIHFAREDSDQHLGSFELTLPPGLLANLSAVSACPDAAIAAAALAPGLTAGDSPTCPSAAVLGSAQVSAGLGAEPLHLNGTVYLAGPYRGAPYSLAIVVPASAGVFDFGAIVQQAALSIDPASAQISVRTDPLPLILAGVPLEIRALTLDLDRPGAIRNPTSCEPMKITGTAISALGRTAPLSSPFQVRNCAGLPFAPKLSVGFSGALRRNGHPTVRAVFRGDPKEAALAGMALTLPAGELLDLRHIRALCARGLALQRCPGGSRLGRMRLESPFLDGALEGPVYLRAPSHGRLPGLIVALNSDRFAFVLRGSTTSRAGRLGIRFPSIPDIPLYKAVLTLAGGRRGIVVNSGSLCRGARRATATANAHNGKRRELRVRPRLHGC